MLRTGGQEPRVGQDCSGLIMSGGWEKGENQWFIPARKVRFKPVLTEGVDPIALLRCQLWEQECPFPACGTSARGTARRLRMSTMRKVAIPPRYSLCNGQLLTFPWRTNTTLRIVASIKREVRIVITTRRCPSPRAIHGDSTVRYPIVIHSHLEDLSNSAQTLLQTLTERRSWRCPRASHPGVIAVMSLVTLLPAPLLVACVCLWHQPWGRHARSTQEREEDRYTRDSMATSGTWEACRGTPPPPPSTSPPPVSLLGSSLFVLLFLLISASSD